MGTGLPAFSSGIFLPRLGNGLIEVQTVNVDKVAIEVEQVLGRTARARRCSCQASCFRCRGTGYVLVSSGASAVAQTCPCRHLDERIALFDAVGIPAAVALASFETFRSWSPDHATSKAAAEDFARKFRLDQPTKGFLVYGRPGAGKTHLVCATLRYLALEKRVACRYVEFMLLLSDIRAGFDSNRGHMEVLRPLVQVPVLAIDELGKERGTDWERSMLDELISRRFNSGLTTLFATLAALRRLSGRSSVNELLAPLRSRSGATTTTSAMAERC